MSWLVRTYQRVGASTRYVATDTRPRYPLPSELTCTRPWAGSINADYVLSPYPSKATLTGLRSNTGGYVGNTYEKGKRRLVVALFCGNDREYMHIAVAPNMPRYKRKAINSGVALLRRENEQRCTR